jgi:mRNA interferase MazF
MGELHAAKIRECNGKAQDTAINSGMATPVEPPVDITEKSLTERVDCTFQGKEGQVALDHIRSVDKTRLVGRLGVLPKATAQQVCDRLQEMFHY